MPDEELEARIQEAIDKFVMQVAGSEENFNRFHAMEPKDEEKIAELVKMEMSIIES